MKTGPWMLIFNPNASGSVDTIALQADHKIIVGGYFSQMGGEAHGKYRQTEQ